MVELKVKYLGILGVLGGLGILTDQPGLFALSALFALFASNRTVRIPPDGSSTETESATHE